MKSGVNVSPIIIRLAMILQIPNQMSITMEENLRLVLLCDLGTWVYWVHQGQNHLPTPTSSIGGMRHPICQLQKHLSQINIASTLETCSHNMHHKLVRTATKDGSIWPSTMKRWHGTQLHTWSFHVLPSRPSNNNTIEGKTFYTYKITHPTITSKVVDVIFCM
jgi:hypothetical protein